MYAAPVVQPRDSDDPTEQAGEEYPNNFNEADEECGASCDPAAKPGRPPMMQTIYSVSFIDEDVHGAPAKPAPEERRDRTPRFCAECGSPLPEGANFCPNCGVNVRKGRKEPEFVCVYAAPGMFKQKGRGKNGSGPKTEEV